MEYDPWEIYKTKINNKIKWNGKRETVSMDACKIPLSSTLKDQVLFQNDETDENNSRSLAWILKYWLISFLKFRIYDVSKQNEKRRRKRDALSF